MGYEFKFFSTSFESLAPISCNLSCFNCHHCLYRFSLSCTCEMIGDYLILCVFMNWTDSCLCCALNFKTNISSFVTSSLQSLWTAIWISGEKVSVFLNTIYICGHLVLSFLHSSINSIYFRPSTSCTFKQSKIVLSRLVLCNQQIYNMYKLYSWNSWGMPCPVLSLYNQKIWNKLYTWNSRGLSCPVLSCPVYINKRSGRSCTLETVKDCLVLSCSFVIKRSGTTVHFKQ